MKGTPRHYAVGLKGHSSTPTQFWLHLVMCTRQWRFNYKRIFDASWFYDIVMTLHQWHIFFCFLYLYILYLICTIQTYGDFLDYANFMQVFFQIYVI